MIRATYWFKSWAAGGTKFLSAGLCSEFGRSWCCTCCIKVFFQVRTNVPLSSALLGTTTLRRVRRPLNILPFENGLRDYVLLNLAHCILLLDTTTLIVVLKMLRTFDSRLMRNTSTYIRSGLHRSSIFNCWDQGKHIHIERVARGTITILDWCLTWSFKRMYFCIEGV